MLNKILANLIQKYTKRKVIVLKQVLAKKIGIFFYIRKPNINIRLYINY